MGESGVIVCGQSGIAVPITEHLLTAGSPVTIVIRAMDHAGEAIAQRLGVPVVVCTGPTEEALLAAGVMTADAVVCVEDGEMANLETALVARRLRPDVRIVTRLANATVAGALTTTAADHPDTVLDVADLAAPSVVEACLGITTHRITAAGMEVVAATVPVRVAGTLREQFGDLAPLAVATAGEIVACPGRDLPVDAGDVATMLGTVDEFAALGLAVGDESAIGERPRPPGILRRARSAVRSFVRDANPNFFRMLLVLLVLLVVSTTVLRLFYRKPGMSVLDAVYFSTETIATVGYGDFTFSDQAVALRIFSIALMFLGLTTTAMVMAFLAELLISRRIAEAAGRRRARFMSGHIVVIGLGAFGIRVARDIAARGRDVVIVERSADNRFLSAAAAASIPVVIGDATLASTLADARVHTAGAVAVLTSDDMANIETGIAVRGVLGDAWSNRPGRRGVPVVLRLFDRAMGDAVAHRFGFRHVRSTTELAVPWFVGAALGLQVVSTFTVQSMAFVVGKLRVAPAGGLVGVAMQELSAHTRVIAIRRHDTGELEYPPRRGTAFAAGDEAYVVGPHEELLAVLEHQRVG
ncbi:NAD-binding protein [Williamsia deligens]|uniref:NAD-binding protein n=1 Tax=Williamsia deligens TaxID=321325 RepID=A0ABW3G9H4_9NOCA|nr:NAD-binding protein [Williamsia deligens]MCP2193700.1 Trk K+ transport system, NAD-binding component [Williamsia deligens]